MWRCWWKHFQSSRAAMLLGCSSQRSRDLQTEMLAKHVKLTLPLLIVMLTLNVTFSNSSSCRRIILLPISPSWWPSNFSLTSTNGSSESVLTRISCKSSPCRTVRGPTIEKALQSWIVRNIPRNLTFAYFSIPLKRKTKMIKQSRSRFILLRWQIRD